MNGPASSASSGRPIQLSESTLRALGTSTSRSRVPSVASNASTFRSRLESETDYGGEDTGFHAPRPRRYSSSLGQPWLQVDGVPRPAWNRPSPPLRYPVSRTSSIHLDDPLLAVSHSPGEWRGARLSTLYTSRMDSPARRWVRWMAKVGLKDVIMPTIIFSSLLARWLVGLGGYSGRANPPMYGDYEAQRHWMEITMHLPISMWYSYDLSYWGLDYPPVTAYLSCFCGYIGTVLNKEWFALDLSRGHESSWHTTYMRWTVIILDASVYFPAAICFCAMYWKSRSHRSKAIACITILLQPALILVDNGHFQYNSVMLGLTLWSINHFQAGYDIIAAVLFMLSLGFKQMALYYSPAIFAYCLGKCIHSGCVRGIHLFLQLAAVVILTTSVLFLPFVRYRSSDLVLQIVTRIFPFDRGLFEDKVANFWCATNVIYKWRQSSTLQHSLPLIAFSATLLGLLPTLLHVLYVSWTVKAPPAVTNSENAALCHPRLPAVPTLFQSSNASPASTLLPFALFNCSMAFFIFSFQVHEKSILLPLMPLTILMSAREDLGAMDTGVWEWGVLFNNTAVFSLWHLLTKDGQTLQYAILTFAWNYLIGYNPLKMSPSFIKLISLCAYGIFGVLHVIQLLFSPPTRYPDLFLVLNALTCFPIFGVCWLYGIKRQMEIGFSISA